MVSFKPLKAYLKLPFLFSSLSLSSFPFPIPSFPLLFPTSFSFPLSFFHFPFPCLPLPSVKINGRKGWWGEWEVFHFPSLFLPLPLLLPLSFFSLSPSLYLTIANFFPLTSIFLLPFPSPSISFPFSFFPISLYLIFPSPFLPNTLLLSVHSPLLFLLLPSPINPFPTLNPFPLPIKEITTKLKKICNYTFFWKYAKLISIRFEKWYEIESSPFLDLFTSSGIL